MAVGTRPEDAARLDAEPRRGGTRRSEVARRALTAGAAVTALLVALLAAWLAMPVLLLLFASLLAGILLHSMARAVSRRTRLGHRWALASLLLVLAIAACGLGALVVPQLVEQAGQLQQTLPQAIDRFEDRIRETGWGRQFLRQQGGLSQQAVSLAGRAFSAFSVALGVVGNALFVLVVGIFLAAEPRVYEQGLLRLVPPAHRPRADQIARDLALTLEWWLIGKLLAMAVVGVLTGIGLALLGSPIAVALALIAALLDFVPNIGPIAAAAPAVLLALADGPQQALWVILLYTGVQAVESYVLTPIIERRTVSLPPALVIAAQFLLGTLLGFLGVVFASPLLAAGLVLLRRLYVEPMENVA